MVFLALHQSDNRDKIQKIIDIMQSQTWRNLLAFESRDLVQKYFMQIHGGTLNARRAREITAASSQAREYFLNASRADNLVKPLLLFYGVASLSRALTLLLKTDGGEETLDKGHGLETISWKSTIGNNDITKGLKVLSTIQIKTRSGAFLDLLNSTRNISCLHVHSEAVDFRLQYDIPATDNVISLGDILSRTPDLAHEYTTWSNDPPLFFFVNDIKIDKSDSLFSINLVNYYNADIKAIFGKDIFEVTQNEQKYTLRCPLDKANDNLPLLVNAYLKKMFGTIPNLYLTVPFAGESRYSQIASSYMLAYTLGMLARYFPTHWTALIRGEKGDAMWPTVNAAVSYIENAFPELVWEFIHDRTKQSGK